MFLDVRSTTEEHDPEITDDEDNNNNYRNKTSTEQDTTELEQQKKRRRTANYQHILSTKPTNASDDDHHERTSSRISTIDCFLISVMIISLIFSIATTDNIRSLSSRRTDLSSSLTLNPDERTNRFTPVKQRFDILPTYRAQTSNYDPTKSPLFSAGNRVSKITFSCLKNLCHLFREPPTPPPSQLPQQQPHPQLI